METSVWNLIDSQTMVNGASNWDDAKSTVRATVFGKMVMLSQGRVKHYHSDLFHDAIWIDMHLIGSMQFDWICRDSGTWIGDIVAEIKYDQYENSAKYRFEILEDNRKWTLNVYEAGLIIPDIPHFCEECGTMVAKYVGYMQMWLCSDYCTEKAENRLGVHDTEYGPADGISEDLGAKYRDKMQEEFALIDEFHPYFSTEPLPERVVEAMENMDVNPINSIIDSLFAGYKTEPYVISDKENFSPYNFPTLRNTSINTKEKTTMDSILRDLREKASDAEEAKGELEEKKYEIDEAISELENYLDEVNGLIDSLDNLPEVSVNVEIDVSFDS